MRLAAPTECLHQMRAQSRNLRTLVVRVVTGTATKSLILLENRTGTISALAMDLNGSSRPRPVAIHRRTETFHQRSPSS
jgi:hypothetical protein